MKANNSLNQWKKYCITKKTSSTTWNNCMGRGWWKKSRDLSPSKTKSKKSDTLTPYFRKFTRKWKPWKKISIWVILTMKIIKRVLFLEMKAKHVRKVFSIKNNLKLKRKKRSSNSSSMLNLVISTSEKNIWMFWFKAVFPNLRGLPQSLVFKKRFNFWM